MQTRNQAKNRNGNKGDRMNEIINEIKEDKKEVLRIIGKIWNQNYHIGRNLEKIKKNIWNKDSKYSSGKIKKKRTRGRIVTSKHRIGIYFQVHMNNSTIHHRTRFKSFLH